MIDSIIEWSVRNRFLVLLVALVLVFVGYQSLRHTPVDAIPDLSDVQVIIKTSYPGQAPQVVEDQVTYPLTTAMLSVPHAVNVRGYSFFGDSFVYVIFEDGTDLYWARSRVLEYLNQVSSQLPPGAKPSLGPDATGVGWIYEYALIDRSGNTDLSQLRSIQDWFLRYELQTVDGVSEVASVGGHVKQYQVVVDPVRLRAFDIPLSRIKQEIQRANQEVGASVIEMAEAEYMVRATGYIKGINDLEEIPLGVNDKGAPILLGNVAEIRLGPQLRRGIAELNGEGEVVGGIVVMRWGENAMKTISAVKEKLSELKRSLPDTVEIIEVYDRSTLIQSAIDNLQEKLVVEFAIVALVCVLFLVHLRSSLVIILTLPLGILLAFIVMNLQGINANIMSLSGIAIAIGTMVDAAIVMVENLHKRIEANQDHSKDRWELVIEASKEVGRPVFYSLLIITLSFLPVFTLEAQEGRLFKPLAFTKTYAMAAAAILAVTLVPVLMGYLVRGRILSERRNPINALLVYLYRPFINIALRIPKIVVFLAIVISIIGFWPINQLGSEFMPELDEGDLMYMPTTLPAISIGKAQQLLQQTDKLIKTVPEVDTVFGKMGRADTATDPAPLTMIETTIQFKPRSEWREGMTPGRLRDELDKLINFPGLTNVWVMPIKNRIDMLATGIKTPVGIKVSGAELQVIERIGKNIEAVIRDIPGTASVYSERVSGGRYIQIDIDQLRAARLGLNIKDVQDVIQAAIGGVNVSETVEGLERYPINIRYPRSARDSIESIRLLPVVTPAGATIPLSDVAEINIVEGPPSIKSENARINGWIYIDIRKRDIGSFVAEAKRVVNEKVDLPNGYAINWSGQYEYLMRAQEKLKLVVPVTIAIIIVLLFMNFRNMTEVLIILGTMPFSLLGGLWLMYWLDYNFSVAVVVGFIALAGVAAETGVVMLLFLDQAYKKFMKRAAQENRKLTKTELLELVVEGAVLRVRPKAMTVATIALGLLPVMLGSGTGSEVMRRIATPMVGGMLTTTMVTLVVIPTIYYLWKKSSL